MARNLDVEVEDQVLVLLEEDEQGLVSNAYITEIYRQNYLLMLLGLFLLSILAHGGVKGVKTMITLTITGVAVMVFLLPGLLAGYDPLLLMVFISAVVTALTSWAPPGES